MGVADNLAGDTAGPANCRAIEPTALPPLGIEAGGVHRRFVAAGECLAQLIARHKQALTMRSACVMEFQLLFVRSIVRKFIFNASAASLRRQRFQQQIVVAVPVQ